MILIASCDWGYMSSVENVVNGTVFSNFLLDYRGGMSILQFFSTFLSDLSI